MQRIVPSQVVSFIDQFFPGLREGLGGALVREFAGEASGLVQMIDNVPDELIVMSERDYADFICSVAAIRERVGLWRNLQDLRINTSLGQMARGFNPVTLIRLLLSTCPDESPSAATVQLSFVTDPELRSNLRNDLGVINRALSNGEWKAATVLAGAAIEALLLWGLQQRSSVEVTTVINGLKASGVLSGKQGGGSPEDWHLHEYIEVTEKLGIIKKQTAAQSRLAKDFRNLIHPGRAQRLAQNCDRGTALSAVAGVEHVVRDLTS